MAARPAAGPLTPVWEPLSAPTTMPPTIPAIKPENSGAPLAKAIPRHKGKATKNTTTLDGKSLLKCLNISIIFYTSIEFSNIEEFVKPLRLSVAVLVAAVR
jgi:hypothetical protein